MLADELLDPIEFNPGGLAVLWAEENSRASLFAALKRRARLRGAGLRGRPGDRRVRAARSGHGDRVGMPLQRLQIVKLWVAADGKAQERVVLDLAGDPQGGATVDTATCETSGAGADQLCTVWRDADFNPEPPALYYARVLENPVCRCSTRANAAGIDCARPASVRPAWAACCDRRFSPAWYTPEPLTGCAVVSDQEAVT